MEFEDILFEVGEDGVAVLTLNRPERMNALRGQTAEDIFGAVEIVKDDDRVRCLVITGAGRAFCSGDDMTHFVSGDPAAAQRERALNRIRRGERLLEEIFGIEKPTIAVVNGPAVGYGMDLSLYCDVRYASESAHFGWYFVRRGLVGTIGGTFILRQLIGLSKAFELTLTGEPIDAREAERIGLVSKVLPPEQLMPEAMQLARKFATSAAPLAQRAVKHMMHRGFGVDWKALGEYQQAFTDVLRETDDHREGIASFLEKRDPLFRGR